jgi:ketosteroid isomerase-like protein
MAVISVALALPLHAQAPAARATLADTLQQVYQRFLDGLRSRDTTMYRELLTPNYVHMFGDSASVSFGRAARLRWDASQASTITEFHLVRCDVESYGDAAVGPCWYRQSGMDGGKPYAGNGVSLVTFVRGADRRWRIAATRPSAAREIPEREPLAKRMP